MRNRKSWILLIIAVFMTFLCGSAPVSSQDVQQALSLAEEGFRLYEQGNYSDSERLFKQALAIYEKTLGPNHLNVAYLLSNLASVYSEQNRYADAEPLYKKALSITEKNLGPDHASVASSLNGLANLYEHLNRPAEAEPLLKRALKIFEKALGRDSPKVAITLNNLAMLYTNQGRYTEAEPLYKKALAIREKSLGLEDPSVADSLNQLARLYHDQERYTDAEPLYKRSLAINEKALRPEHPEIAYVLNNLGLLYIDQGRYADAEPLYKRALAINEKSFGLENSKVSTSLNGLGRSFEQQGRHAEAEPLYKRALSIDEKVYGPEHPNVSAALSHLAALYDNQRRYAEAEPLYKRALEIDEKALRPKSEVSTALNNLAVLYNNQGLYGDAMPLVRRTIGNRTSDKNISFRTLYGAREAKLINAGQAFTESYEVLQFTMGSAAGEAVSKLAQRYAVGTDELAKLVRKDQDLSAESGRLDKGLIAAMSKMSKERNQSAEDGVRNRIEEIEVERRKIAEQLSSRFPNYVALSQPQPLSLVETQRLLADDEALVAFCFDDQSYAWVVTKTEASWQKIPATSKSLNDEVSELRNSLTFATDKPFNITLSHKIYDETFRPIAAKIASKKRLSIVTNGALTSLPLSLLVVSEPTVMKLRNADWLIKSYAITVVPSIYSLKTMRTQASGLDASKPIIAFADPLFMKQAPATAKGQSVAMRSLTSYYHGSQLDIRSLGATLTPLPGTRQEVEAIGKNLNASPKDLRFGSSATETAVKTAPLDQYKVVYFATHGLVAGDLEKFAKAKAEPSLVLSIPDKPSEKDDGLLQASEISQLKMNAEWAVLSACNTASGDGVGAEALSGLARAFLYAGARSLVVSHWDVSDDATTALMSSLFSISASKPNFSHGEALREATLSLIDSAKSEEDAHPRVWAPFVVVGEPAKM